VHHRHEDGRFGVRPARQSVQDVTKFTQAFQASRGPMSIASTPRAPVGCALSA
jgi:hypothetical protein